MAVKIDHERIAALLPAASGTWVPISESTNSTLAHSRVNNWRPGVNSRRPKPYGRIWERYQFRVKSDGYATGTGVIQARHMPATFPLPHHVAAVIAKREAAGLIPHPTPDDYEEQ